MYSWCSPCPYSVSKWGCPELMDREAPRQREVFPPSQTPDLPPPPPPPHPHPHSPLFDHVDKIGRPPWLMCAMWMRCLDRRGGGEEGEGRVTPTPLTTGQFPGLSYRDIVSEETLHSSYPDYALMCSVVSYWIFTWLLNLSLQFMHYWLHIGEVPFTDLFNLEMLWESDLYYIVKVHFPRPLKWGDRHKMVILLIYIIYKNLWLIWCIKKFVEKYFVFSQWKFTLNFWGRLGYSAD